MKYVTTATTTYLGELYIRHIYIIYIEVSPKLTPSKRGKHVLFYTSYTFLGRNSWVMIYGPFAWESGTPPKKMVGFTADKSGVRNVHTRPKWGSQRSHNSQFPMFEDKILVKNAPHQPTKHSLELCLCIYTPSDYQDVPLWTLCLKMFLRKCHHSLQACSIPTVSAPDNRSNTLWSCRTCSELRQSLRLLVHPTIYTHLSMIPGGALVLDLNSIIQKAKPVNR